MAKTSTAPRITKRGELVQFARELGLSSLGERELLRAIEAAEDTNDPRACLQEYAKQLPPAAADEVRPPVLHSAMNVERASKPKQIPRAELVRYARELGIDDPSDRDGSRLRRIIDTAQDSDDPREHLRNHAAKHFPHAARESAELPASPACPRAMDEIDPPVEPSATTSKATADTPVDAAMVQLPMLDQPRTGFKSRSIQHVSLYGHNLASSTIHRLRAELRERQAVLLNGQQVKHHDQAVLWLLEQYGLAAGVPDQ